MKTKNGFSAARALILLLLDLHTIDIEIVMGSLDLVDKRYVAWFKKQHEDKMKVSYVECPRKSP